MEKHIAKVMHTKQRAKNSGALPGKPDNHHGNTPRPCFFSTERIVFEKNGLISSGRCPQRGSAKSSFLSGSDRFEIPFIYTRMIFVTFFSQTTCIDDKRALCNLMKTVLYLRHVA